MLSSSFPFLCLKFFSRETWSEAREYLSRKRGSAGHNGPKHNFTNHDLFLQQQDSENGPCCGLQKGDKKETSDHIGPGMAVCSTKAYLPRDMFRRYELVQSFGFVPAQGLLESFVPHIKAYLCFALWTLLLRPAHRWFSKAVLQLRVTPVPFLTPSCAVIERGHPPYSYDSPLFVHVYG